MRRLIADISILFLLAAATIIFEISLSRLFSYMLSYHFVLIIIAFSILGIGIGQLAYSRYSDAIERSLNWWYALLPISIFLSYLLLGIIPAIPFLSRPDVAFLVFILLAMLPLFVIGIIYAQILQANKSKVSLIYGIDLIGAATGASLSVILLNSLSLATVVGTVAVLFLFAFFIKVIRDKFRYATTIVVFAAVMLYLASSGSQNLDQAIQMVNDPSKDMLRLMSNPAIESEIIDSRWSSFGKSDLVQLNPTQGTQSRVLFIDGAAGTSVVSIDELRADTSERIRALGGFPAIFSLNLLHKEEMDSALIIGPGGGIDIAATFFTGFAFIEAVEVNPSFVELMEAYNPSTFLNQDNIKVHIGEGRNFVRKRPGKYDAILLTIPVTKSGRGVDFYGLTENYLFTVDALSDYLEGLTEEGSIFFTMHGREEVYRMLANFLQMQENRGISAEEAFKKVYVISNGMNPVLVIKKKAFEPARIDKIHLAAHLSSLDRDVFFFPFVPQVAMDSVVRGNINFAWYMFDDLLYEISRGKYPYSKLWEASLINLRPVTDDSPYFFNYNQGIPDVLTMPYYLGIGIIVWFILRLLKGSGLTDSADNQRSPFLRKKFVYLSAMVFVLGFSYFFMQAYLFQTLNLKLSNPSQSFSLLLFTFLIGNGLGSFFTGSFKTALAQKIMIYTLVIIGVSILTVFLLIPRFYDQLSEIGITSLLLLPAFFVGIPFPILLNMAADLDYRNAVSVLLGISSIAGVAASIFAVIISIVYGYKIVFLVGLIGYGLIIFGAVRLKMMDKQLA